MTSHERSGNRHRSRASYRSGTPFSISGKIGILIPDRGTGDQNLKQKFWKATLTDPHLWIPLIVLAIGIGLLAALA